MDFLRYFADFLYLSISAEAGLIFNQDQPEAAKAHDIKGYIKIIQAKLLLRRIDTSIRIVTSIRIYFITTSWIYSFTVHEQAVFTVN